jgi:zinc/manganese transport system substrate-binding protein
MLHTISFVRTAATLAVSGALLVPTPAAAQQRINVVATLPTYAAIAREITGDLANVRAIARGDEDPHFVNPRPSFAAAIQRADLFITTGLDLELWVPALMDRANNPKVIEGAAGHVVAYAGIKLLDVPENVSRAGGDIHIFGNPHIHTDPVNGIIIARNIAAGLRRVDAGNRDTYNANLAAFESRVLQRTFGTQLVEMLGTETLFDLASTYQFWTFARGREFQGRPLTSYLGGWLADAEIFRGERMICYHKTWAYFSARFDVGCAMYIEAKPGIPPTPGHVRAVMDFIQRERIQVLVAENYYSRSQVERVAERTGIRAVMVPHHVAGEEGVDDYFTLIDTWVSRVGAAFEGARSRTNP